MAEKTLRLQKPKGATSAVWDHFGFEIDEKGQRVDEKAVRCTLCDKNVRYSNNTTNLKQHLQAWHPAALSKGESSKSPQQTTMEAFSQKESPKLPRGSRRAKDVTQAIAEFVSKDMRPVAVVEGVGFRNLVATLDPAYQIPSRKSVMEVLHRMYDEVRSQVEAELSQVKHVSFTADFWTSVATDSFLGISVHFVREWKLRSYILQTREVRESHTAEVVARNLESMLSEWKLEEKLVSMTRDNARNIVAALNKLHWQQIPCTAHTLQIAVNQGLKLQAVKETLSRCRRIVSHFKHSYVSQNALEAAQERLELPKHKLIQEVTTRWNSAFAMLERLTEQQAAVSAVLAESKTSSDRDLILSSSEIAKIECIMGVLKPLAQATEMLSVEKMPSVSIVQPILTALLKRHLTPSDVEPSITNDLKSVISRNMQQHFSDESLRSLMLVASALDPRFKGLKFLSSSERSSVYSDLLRHVTSKAAEQEEEEEAVRTNPPSPKRPCTGGDLLNFHESSSDSNGSSPAMRQTSQAEKEVTAYKAEEQIAHDSDPLEWWKVHAPRLPILASLAYKYLCVQATSVPAERLFSDAGTIVSKKRNSLKPDNIDCLLFLHRNM